ncbi:MAG: N-acetyltransferase [Pseudomonadota bacterium]
MNVRIRPALESDAAEIADLYGEFTRYLRGLGEDVQERLTAAVFVRDGFGPNAAFSTLVAEAPSSPLVGYLIFTLGYDAEHAQRILHVVDLYVADHCRQQGIGAQLMRAAGESAKVLGAARARWIVARSNTGARTFYERLGAEEVDAMYMEWVL